MVENNRRSSLNRSRLSFAWHFFILGTWIIPAIALRLLGIEWKNLKWLYFRILTKMAGNVKG